MGYSALNPAYVQVPGENSPGVAATRQPTYPNSTVGPYFRRAVAWPGTAAVGDVASGAQSIPYFVPATPEVYAYDADGNLTSDGRCTYTWNGENQLVQVDLKAELETLPSVAFEGSWVYEYDYIGRRVRKYRRTLMIENMMMGQGIEEGESPQNQSNFGEGGGELGTITDETKFLYDGWLLTVETTGNTPLRSYFYGLDLSGSTSGAAGIGGLLFQLNGMGAPTASNTRWFCHDPQGNVTSLRSVSDNTRIASLETGPYGDQSIADGQVDELKLRFSGKYWDQETGSEYYGRRFLDLTTSHWRSRDAIDEFGGINLYNFAFNRPSDAIDAIGEKTITFPEAAIISHVPNLPYASFRNTGLSVGMLPIDANTMAYQQVVVAILMAGLKASSNDPPPKWILRTDGPLSLSSPKEHRGYVFIRAKIHCECNAISKIPLLNFGNSPGFTPIRIPEVGTIKYTDAELHATNNGQRAYLIQSGNGCITIRYSNASRLAWSERMMGSIAGYEAPYITRSIEYRMCCDGAGSITYSGSPFPSHSAYLDGAKQGFREATLAGLSLLLTTPSTNSLPLVPFMKKSISVQAQE